MSTDIQYLLDSGLPIPGGDHPISQTLILRNRTGAVVNTVNGGAKLRWTGPLGGVLLQLDGVLESRIGDLHLDGGGVTSANILVTDTGYGCSYNVFDGITSMNPAPTGAHIQAGINPGDANAAGLDFLGCTFKGGESALRVMHTQGVDYKFHGGSAQDVGICFDFQRGGNLTVNGFGVSGRAGTVVLNLNDNAGGDNAYFFNMIGVRIESGTLVRSTSVQGAHVNLIGCQQTSLVPTPVKGGWDYSKCQPAIIAANRSRVVAQGCTLYGPIKRTDPAQVLLRDCCLSRPLLADAVVAAAMTGCVEKYWHSPMP